jgi:hypothetical protein
LVNIFDVLFGLWVAVSPFILGLSGNLAALWNNVTVGIALALLAVLGGWRSRSLLVWTVPLGAWLFISAFLLLHWNTALFWNNVVMAFVVVAGAAISEGLRSGEPAAVSSPP